MGKFCSRDTAGSPERARSLHLARSGSQSQRAIWFILPACGASHIINIYIKARFSFRKVISNSNHYHDYFLLTCRSLSKIAACGLFLVVINLACIKTWYTNIRKYIITIY